MGRVHADERDQICNGATVKKLWMKVIHGADWDEGKCGPRRRAAPSQETVKRGKKGNIFKHNYCDVALSPNGDVAHHGRPRWPKRSQSRLSSLKLNKQSRDYHPSVTRRSGNGSGGEHAAWFEGILNVRGEPRMWTWLCVTCLLGQMTKQGWHTLSLVWVLLSYKVSSLWRF